MKNARSSKGFFFVLISFIMVLYIFAYISAWASSVEVSERVSSEKFRDSTIEGVVSQLNDAKFGKFFEFAGYYAIYSMNANASVPGHELKYGPANELGNYSSAFFNLLVNGTSREFNGAPVAYDTSEIYTYTMSGWFANLNSSLSQAGLEVKEFKVNDTVLNQTGLLTMNASMTVTILVQDRIGTLSLNRTFRMSREFNLSGLPDPMIARESRRAGIGAVEKQIFLSASPISSLAPQEAGTGAQGQGFFYGPMVAAASVTLASPANRNDFILVGSFDDVKNVPGDYNDFGAIILTNTVDLSDDYDCESDTGNMSEDKTFYAIQYSRPPCIIRDRTLPDGTVESYCDRQDCERHVYYPIGIPFVVIPDLNMNSFTAVADPGGDSTPRPHALIIAGQPASAIDTSDPFGKFSTVNAYNIEALRDAAVCSPFFQSSRGPSYVQRLSANVITDSLHSTAYGLETLLVGKWAGGADSPPAYEDNSRVDFEFFRGDGGKKIRGMPGCKNFEMCSTATGSDAPLGHFRLGPDSIAAYGAQKISCTDGRSGCGS